MVKFIFLAHLPVDHLADPVVSIIIIIKWTRKELKQMDQRKIMTMHKALHPGDDVDRLYVLRKEVFYSPNRLGCISHEKKEKESESVALRIA